MIKKEKTIMLQQVMTNPGEIIFREVPFQKCGKDYEYWCLWIRYSCLHRWKTSVYKISGNTGHEVSGESQNLEKCHRVSCGTEGVEPFRLLWCYPCRHGKYNLCEELKVMPGISDDRNSI